MPASRTAEVANDSMSSQPLSSATTSASATKSVSASSTGLGHVAVVVEVLGQPQRLLVRERRQGCRTVVGVHHQQMTGVGADVEDAEAHASNLPVARAAACEDERGARAVR